ncbi:hypothetical protein [Streptomyces triculaminicus]|uniref:hypothetical protein n=1 Tax=Streptomyces triculaminicus TaxID=2816232 RepID=UPI0037D87A4E
MLLTTEGATLHKKEGLLLEVLVNDGFEGAAENVLCIKHEHNQLIHGSPTGQGFWTMPSGRRVPEGQAVAAGRVGMPLELLREPYERFRKYRTTQSLDWKIGGSPVTIMESFRKR